MIDQRAILDLDVILRAAEFQQHVFAAGRDECAAGDDAVTVLRLLDFNLADLVQARGPGSKCLANIFLAFIHQAFQKFFARLGQLYGWHCQAPRRACRFAHAMPRATIHAASGGALSRCRD